MPGRTFSGFRPHGLRLVAVLVALATSAAASAAKDAAQTAGAPAGVPQYALDTSWPKLPLPNRWAFGWISGIFADARDHIWVVATPRHGESWLLGNSNDPSGSNQCCAPMPPVAEFDAQGNLLQAWGGPGKGYDWPSGEHGIFVDYKGNVWIAGNQTRPGPDGSPPDGMVLKFTHDGKFLLQIGGRGPSKGSLDTTLLSGAAGMFVDKEADEVYIADGYGNHRVIVFDADTGKFKRQWGAYGKPPTDEKVTGSDPKSSQFHIVHCVTMSKDRLVYVCDRINDRLQVFKPDGTFVTEYVYAPGTRQSGSVGNVTFWPDATQSMMALNDPGNFQTVIVRRSTGEELSRFGHFGNYAGEYQRNHQMEFDSRGYLYTSEDYRVQRFKIVNGVKPDPHH
jgi:hypothetical protein